MKLIKRIFYITVIIAVALLATSFSVQNSHTTILYYYFGNVELPLSIMLVLAFSIGVFLAFIGGSFMVIKLRFALNQSKKRHQKLESKHREILTQLDKKSEFVNTNLKVAE